MESPEKKKSTNTVCARPCKESIPIQNQQSCTCDPTVVGLTDDVRNGEGARRLLREKDALSLMTGRVVRGRI
jgi:hypothetical protein